MSAFEVELCVDSVASAVEAEKLGADRVELCARLDLDGLTPSFELIAATRAAVDIGVYVMIRPREGDFCYSTEELDEMLASLKKAKTLGIDGLVAGALQADLSLDLIATQQLIEACGDLPFTFHRAFDVCKNPLTALEQLKAAGVARILSSGQAPKAIDGIELLKQMQSASGHLGIMAGSGVNANNIPHLWENGIRQFHFTSHTPNAEGVNVFNVQKATLAMQTLHQL